MASPITMTNIDARLEDSRLVGTAGYIAPLILQPQYGFVPQRLSPGYPDPRDVSEKRPSQNGTFDFTTYFGARAVSLEVAFASELQNDPLVTDLILEDRLRRWMAPDVRPYLYVRYSPVELYRRIKLRATNVASQLAFLTTNEFRSVSLAWRGIDGVFESADLSSEFIEVGGSSELGRTYDLVFDRTYAASAVIGTKEIINAGTAPTYPIVQIFGPCTQPRLENQTTGKKLEFLASYALVAGEYLEINFAEGTVALNGDPALSQSRYDKIDFVSGISEWWNLIPGSNFVRFYPLSSSAPSKVRIDWRSAYI